MEDIFVSDYFALQNELKEAGVFDSIINRDSNFFINLLRLKNTSIPEFIDSYEHINQFFSQIMLLLDQSNYKGDRFYKAAVKKFSFSEVNGINLGFSESKTGSGFGKKLTDKVISDAFDIVKSGSKQPEIFHLIGLFEDNIAADRLSDMIATIIINDIRAYTRRINKEIGIDSSKYPHLIFKTGIAFNPYKQCELLLLPEEILHELPIARDWSDIDRVISENESIRREVNEAVGNEWYKMASTEKKEYLKKQIFLNPERCARVLSGYEKKQLSRYDLINNTDYFVATVFKKIKDSGAINCLYHSMNAAVDSNHVALIILEEFRHWVEDCKGWEEIQQAKPSRREKSIQKLIHLCGNKICKDNNFDFSFESNEGPGPSDIKISRGSKDKTVIEVKLNTNPQYLHGYEEQIELYKKAEETNNAIYVYIKIDNHPSKDKKMQDCYAQHKLIDDKAPNLYVIDARMQKSASKY